MVIVVEYVVYLLPAPPCPHLANAAGAVSWSRQKETIVALSSTEAEFVVLTHASRDDHASLKESPLFG
jgi:hypothetical protein